MLDDGGGPDGDALLVARTGAAEGLDRRRTDSHCSNTLMRPGSSAVRREVEVEAPRRLARACSMDGAAAGEVLVPLVGVHVDGAGDDDHNGSDDGGGVRSSARLDVRGRRTSLNLGLRDATLPCEGRSHDATQAADAVAGLLRGGRRCLRGGPRPVDRERGLPVDRALVPRGVGGDAVVGAVGLQRGVRRPAARRRPHRRPLGPAALVPQRRGRVHPRLAALRRGHLAGDADRRPGGPGGRCRPADAGLAGAAARCHPRRAAAAGRRHVGRHLRPRGGHRPVARRRAHRRRRLALGLLHQPARPRWSSPS